MDIFGHFWTFIEIEQN